MASSRELLLEYELVSNYLYNKDVVDSFDLFNIYILYNGSDYFYKGYVDAGGFFNVYIANCLHKDFFNNFDVETVDNFENLVDWDIENFAIVLDSVVVLDFVVFEVDN